MKIQKIFFLLYLLIGFLPAFGAVDKVGFQWLYLSVLNVLYLSYCITSRTKLKLPLNKSFSSLALFTFFSASSIIFSLNLSESLIEIARFLSLLTLLIILFNILNVLRFDFNQFKKIVTYLLFVEVSFFFIILFYNYQIFEVVNIKGISSNINIQAFSIVFKLPIVLVSFISSKFKRSYLDYITLWFSISILFIISSRASLLSLIIVFLFFLFYKFDFIENLKNFIKIFLPGFLFSFFLINPLLKTDSKLSGLTVINESSLTRIQFYKEAFNSILESPFFGVGLGNWKLFGIQAHKEFVNGYTIPYHAHNDFLQIGAESGIFALGAYLFFFIFLALGIFKLFKTSKSFMFALLLPLIAYLIDANLNFPISRPLVQVQFLFFTAFVFYLTATNLKKSFRIHLSITSILILIGSLSIFSAFKVYDSFTKQQFLLSDFQSQKFDTPINIIESIDDDYPNIGATALPIKAIKANYYTDSEKVSSLLTQAAKDNPFIKYPQVLKSIKFRGEGILDSSLYYAKNAFNGLPYNELHIINYFSILTELKDSTSLDVAFKKVKKLESTNVLNSYLLANLTLKRENKEIKELTNSAVIKYPNDNRFKLYNLRINKGDSIIKLANELFRNAEKLFNDQKYLTSAQTYLKASKLLPEDPAYLENAAHGYYMANQNNKALKLFDSVINNFSSKTGKSEYLKGLMLIETQNNYIEACDLFLRSMSKENPDAEKAINLFCK